jgi:hypothetical protein
MFLFSDHSRELSDPASRQGQVQSIYDRLPNGRLLSTIRGANHFRFSDQMLLKSHYVIGMLRRLGFGSLEGAAGSRSLPSECTPSSTSILRARPLPSFTCRLKTIPKFNLFSNNLNGEVAIPIVPDFTGHRFF